MIKVELHTHTADDPRDLIPHTTADLIDHAASLGFGALAVTLHEKQLDPKPYEGYARERGVVLIRGIEQTIRGKHVLLLNFPAATERVQSLDDVATLKRHYPNGLVIAPHAFYPSFTCLRGLMDRYAALFDAVEINYFFTREVDFNTPAIAWAERHGTPLVGNSDLHRLYQMGRTYSLVDAAPSADAICAAVRAGRVEVHREAIAMREALTYYADLAMAGVEKTWRDLWPQPEPATRPAPVWRRASALRITEQD